MQLQIYSDSSYRPDSGPECSVLASMQGRGATTSTDCTFSHTCAGGPPSTFAHWLRNAGQRSKLLGREAGDVTHVVRQSAIRQDPITGHNRPQSLDQQAIVRRASPSDMLYHWSAVADLAASSTPRGDLSAAHAAACDRCGQCRVP